ncbi:MAG: polysaccharide deacetylase family protein [Geobacteraceae bacterium]|nr:polysaccharide deacetylase family protein [Geobacteraceae bacterium]
MTNGMLAKRGLSAIVSRIGLLSLAEKYILSRKSVVLMYHRVLPSIAAGQIVVQPGMYVSNTTFENHIEYLNRCYKIVFIDELVDKILNNEYLGGYCALTFDDGWLDNYTNAFPILKKHHVPATIFLATGFIGAEKLFWPEEICFYLERFNLDSIASNIMPPATKNFMSTIVRYKHMRREQYFENSIAILKKYSSRERTGILEYFRNIIKIGSIPRQMINWDEARNMLSSGLVRFGAHSVNHEILDQVSPEIMKDEILTSRGDIEHHLGCCIKTFAYPNGNHNKNISCVLEENGFYGAVTTQKGFLCSTTSPMKIPRVAVHEDVSTTISLLRARILSRFF